MKSKLTSSKASYYTNTFSNYLFQKDTERLQKRVLDLVKENHQAGGSPDGFLYRGVFYNNLRSNIFSKGQRGNLMPSMEDSMIQYLKDVKKTSDDRTKVRQVLANLLLPCKSEQDVRDVLPESLIEVIPELRQMPRTRPEAFTLVTELHRSQYAEFKDLISIYLMARMFL